MKKIKINGDAGAVTRFVMCMFYLAWKACGGPLGMGVFQDNPSATEQDVFNNINTQGDYPGAPVHNGGLYADYVFGRMMKFGVETNGNVLTFGNTKWRPDYQAFCRKYQTIESLLEATTVNSGITYETVS